MRIGTLTSAALPVTVADETTRNASGIAERPRLRGLVDDDAEAMRDLRAMVSPFTEVTVLANARGVTSRAGLADRRVLRRARGLPRAARRRAARMRGRDAAAKPVACVLRYGRAAKPVVAIERQEGV